MMRLGTCPQCRSDTVYVQNEGIYFHRTDCLGVRDETQNTVYKSLVCTTCGYFENYLTDPEIIKKISDHWTKVKVVEKGDAAFIWTK
jgi:hypothetical protein